MKFDDYDTFLFNHPYISVFTVNLAPIFSDLLGRFVCLMENLFGTSQKTDTAAKTTLDDKQNAATPTPLDRRGVQSPPTNATATVPAATSKAIQPGATNSNAKPSVDDDNEVDEIGRLTYEATSEDKYNLYSSLAKALNIDDPKTVKRTLVEKGNQLLKSIEDLVGDDDNFVRSKRGVLHLVIGDVDDSIRRLKDQLEQGNIPKDEIERIEKRIEQHKQNLVRSREFQKVGSFANALCEWYHGCSEQEEANLEARYRESYNSEKLPRFLTNAPFAIRCFGEGFLPETVDIDNKGGLKALAIAFDVKIILHDAVWTPTDSFTSESFGSGPKTIHLYKNENQYSSTLIAREKS